MGICSRGHSLAEGISIRDRMDARDGGTVSQ